MVIEGREIAGKGLKWMLRCPTKEDALELSKVRVQIDGETEYLDREAGEGLLTQKDFEELIDRDRIAERNLFLVAEAGERIVGFARCEGNTLSRFRHKAEFGICILKEYWGFGIGRVLLESILQWADAIGLVKISLNVVEVNTKAIELYRQYGFAVEGVLKKDRIHKDGKYYNTIVMGRLSEQ